MSYRRVAGRRHGERHEGHQILRSDRLDGETVECFSQRHYRPAIKDDQTVDDPMMVKVDWSL